MPVTVKDQYRVDLSNPGFSFSLKNKVARTVWKMCYWILFRPFNLDYFKNWRCSLLRLFGAKIGENTNVFASVKIWAPWNLEVGAYSSIGPQVDCYNQGKIKIGTHTVISQKTYLCASTHDYTVSNYPLKCRPIEIGDQVWIAADAFIGPGITIGDGVVVGARAAVFKNAQNWTVIGGNPSKFIKYRQLELISLVKQ